MSDSVKSTAARGWAQERTAYPRAAYVAGYERAVRDSVEATAAQVAADYRVVQDFAGERAPELVAYLLRGPLADHVLRGGR